MRKIILGILLLWTLGSSAQSQMSQVLRQMPATVIPYLSENNKLDMIDFMDSKMKAEVHNMLEGKSELTKLTDSYAALSLTPATQVAIRLLDVEVPVDSASQILCVVSTYGVDVRDSQIDFYSLNWRKLEASSFITLPDGMFTASIDEQQPLLTLTTSAALNYPASEEQEKLAERLITFKWDNKRFK